MKRLLINFARESSAHSAVTCPREASWPRRGVTEQRDGTLGGLVVVLLLLLAALPAGASQSADTAALRRLEQSLNPTSPAAAGRVSQARISEIAETTALLTWMTDIPVTAEYGCGLAPQALTTGMNLAAETQHAQTLSALVPGTLYFYRIVGRDDVTGTFITAGRAPLRYESLGGATVDAHTLRVEWTTNHPAAMVIGLRHAADTDYPTRYDKPVEQRQHTVMFGGLRAGQRYYFIVQSTDSTGCTVNTGERMVTMPEANVALHRPVTGTFEHLPADANVQFDSDPRVNVTDGDDAFFTGTVNSGDVHAAEQWATVDLGESVAVRSVVTVWRRLAYPQAFRLYGSSDGGQWELLAWNIDAGAGAELRSSRGDPLYLVTTPAAGKCYRYVKVVVPKGSRFFVKHPEWRFVQLVELKVFAEE